MTMAIKAMTVRRVLRQILRQAILMYLNIGIYDYFWVVANLIDEDVVLWNPCPVDQKIGA